MFKKLLISLLLVSALLPTFAVRPAHAQWYNQDPVTWYKHVYDSSNPTEIFGERYTAAQVDWIIMSFLTWPATKFFGPESTACLIEGITNNNLNVDSCKAIYDKLRNAINNFKAVLSQSEPRTSTLASLVKTLNQDKPLSGITYTKNIARNFHLISQVHAQTGFGYGRFQGVTQDVWTASRNVSYALFVLVAIIFSFMIMFRVKISPQTVIAVQSALPKLIIALILATFSFAIAGFMVDIMYVVIGILSLILDPVIPNAITNVLKENTFELLTEGFVGTGVLGFLLFDLFAYPITFIFALIALPGGVFGNLFTLGGLVLLPLALIFALIFFIILIFALGYIHIKIILLLFKTVAYILLLVMFAPIQITLGLIFPGLGFSGWLRSLASHLAVFPILGLFFSLSFIFLAYAFDEALKTTALGETVSLFGLDLGGAGMGFVTGWPPLLGFGGGDIGALILLGVSLTLLFLAPKTAEIIKGLITGRPLSYGMAAGEALAFGVGLGGITGVTRQAAGRAVGSGITGAVGARMTSYGGVVGKVGQVFTHPPGTKG